MGAIIHKLTSVLRYACIISIMQISIIFYYFNNGQTSDGQKLFWTFQAKTWYVCIYSTKTFTEFLLCEI